MAVIKIALTMGRFAIIDDADEPLISQYKWRALRNQQGQWYAIRSERGKSSGRSTILMHRVILGAPKGVLVDHKNSDGLDNRRENLRLATQTQNQANRGARRDSRIGMKGVGYCRGRYSARLTINRKKISLGHYDTAEQAHAAYLESASKFFGEFARAE